MWYLGVVSSTLSYFLERLTNKAKDYLDKTASFIAQDHSRQSDRYVARITLFKCGIDKNKLTGKEHCHQIFMICIEMATVSFIKKLVSLEANS